MYTIDTICIYTRLRCVYITFVMQQPEKIELWTFQWATRKVKHHEFWSSLPSISEAHDMKGSSLERQKLGSCLFLKFPLDGSRGTRLALLHLASSLAGFCTCLSHRCPSTTTTTTPSPYSADFPLGRGCFWARGRLASRVIHPMAL